MSVVLGGGSTLNLGSLGKGTQTFDTGGSSSYQIRVAKSSGAGFLTPSGTNAGTVLQTSTDSNLAAKFFSPRGVAVVTDPTNSAFGRIYVANAGAGTTASPARAVGDGMYLLNADQTDAVGQGNTARNAGLDFSGSTSSSPYRLHVGKDGLYITDWSDVNGNVYRTDFNVSDGSGKAVLNYNNATPGTSGSFPVLAAANHGSIAGAVTTGSLATNDLKLFTIDEDLQDNKTATAATQRNSLWRYDLGGTATPFAGDGTRLFTPTIGSASLTMDVAIGPASRFYITQYRANGTEAGLYVRNNDGTALWNSLTATRALPGNTSTTADILLNSTGVEVSPKGDVMAVVRTDGDVWVLPLLADGTPDLANRLLLNTQTQTTATSTARDVAFDAAGNLYFTNFVTGNELLKVFSPGGDTVAITGSDGTFSYTNSVPEPASIGLVGTAAAGLLMRRRGSRRR